MAKLKQNLIISIKGNKPQGCPAYYRKYLKDIPERTESEVLEILTSQEKKPNPRSFLHYVYSEIKKTCNDNGLFFGYSNNSLYRYSEKVNFWQYENDSDKYNFIVECCIKLGVSEETLNAKVDSANFCDRVLYLLHKDFKINFERKAVEEEDGFININFQNGVLHIDLNTFETELHPHNRFYQFRYIYPYSYEPGANCPNFIHFLNEVIKIENGFGRADSESPTDTNAILNIQEFWGYCLLTDNKQEKALIQLGVGSNGKSLLNKVLINVFGIDAVSSLNIDQITNPVYREGMIGKLVNIASEIGNGNIYSTDDMKGIISGESLAVNPKYLRPYLNSVWPKLIFNANKLPEKVEHTEGYWRRFLIIPFLREFTESERNTNYFNEYLAKEMPGVFNWILEGLKRLSIQGKFTENENAKKALNEAREQSDVVLQFLNDEYIRPGTKAECRGEKPGESTITFDGEKLESDELKLESIYNYFKTYCIDNGYKPMANKTLKKRMQLYKYDFEKTRDGQVTWVYYIENNNKGQNFMHRSVKVEDKPPF